MKQHDARVHGEKGQEDCGHGTHENKHPGSNWAEQLWKILSGKKHLLCIQKDGPCSFRITIPGSCIRAGSE